MTGVQTCALPISKTSTTAAGTSTRAADPSRRAARHNHAAGSAVTRKTTGRAAPARFTFDYATGNHLEAYEKLIHDALLGDRTLFTRADGIERLWEVSAPLLDDPPPVQPYAPGSWGPESLKKLVRPHHWYLPDGK